MLATAPDLVDPNLIIGAAQYRIEVYRRALEFVESVQVLLDKILDDVEPENAPILIDPLTRVTSADVGAWNSKWEQWLAR